MRYLTRAMWIIALSAVPVFPCGGPATNPIDAPLLRIDAYFAAVQDVSDGFDSHRRPELRFLYPFRGTPGVNDALWRMAYPDASYSPPPAYDSTAHFVRPDTSALKNAIRQGNQEGATLAARAIVRAVLNTPAIETAAYDGALKRAVEWLDIAPHAAGEPKERVAAVLLDNAAASDGPLGDVAAARTAPRQDLDRWLQNNPRNARRASLTFAAIREAMKREIPNGWSHEFRDSVAPEVWRGLERRHTEWLAQWPSHPLRPWVQLSRSRLAYFRGDEAAAWEPLLVWYASGEHRPRVLAEMRYLVMQSVRPPQNDQRIDATLKAALLTEQTLTTAAWNDHWRDAQALDRQLRTRTEERLLWHAAHSPLRDSLARLTMFPTKGAAPSMLWAQLRAVALAQSGQREAALEQLASIPNDSTLAPLRAQLLLSMGHWSQAISAPKLPFEARRYLLRVMAPDSVLASVSSVADVRLANEARLVRAVRLASNGDWAKGTALLRPNDRRAMQWSAAARLTRDSSATGRLAWARWLAAHSGALFYGVDKTWYRSLNWRVYALADTSEYSTWSSQLPWSKLQERSAIAEYLTTSYERYAAIRVYAEWLRGAPRGNERRRVAGEADALYKWLVNWDNNNSTFFKEQMEVDGTARAIRAAGR